MNNGTFNGIHLGMGINGTSGDMLNTDFDNLQFLYGHDEKQSLAAALMARKRLFMRPVQSWHADIPMEAWHHSHHDERVRLAEVTKRLGKQMYEPGPNEPLPGTDWGTYGFWEAQRAKYLHTMYGITAVIGNFSVGTTNEGMMREFMGGFMANKVSSRMEENDVPFVVGVHEGASLTWRMWFDSGYLDEDINTVDITQPWPLYVEAELPQLMEKGMWLWCRFLKYAHLFKDVPGFKGWVHTETALDHIDGGKWSYKYKWATGIRDFLNIWRDDYGITNGWEFYAKNYADAVRVAAQLSDLLGVPYLGANLWILGDNWNFQRHNVSDGLKEFQKLMPPREPQPDITEALAHIEALMPEVAWTGTDGSVLYFGQDKADKLIAIADVLRSLK